MEKQDSLKKSREYNFCNALNEYHEINENGYDKLFNKRKE